MATRGANNQEKTMRIQKKKKKKTFENCSIVTNKVMKERKKEEKKTHTHNERSE